MLLKTVYSNVKIKGPNKFKIGQHVRISKYKQLFAKGYTPNWSTEIFTIKTIQRTNPVTYLLEDSQKQTLLGGFYEYELQPVADPEIFLVEKILRRKKDKVFVKWLGLSEANNSWIHKNNVL